MLLEEIKKGARRERRIKTDYKRIAQNESSVTGRTRIDPPCATKEEPKKRLEDSEKCLPRGKRMVLASLQKKRDKHMPNKKKGEKNAGSQKKTAKSSKKKC